MMALGFDPGKRGSAVAFVEAVEADGELRPVCRRVEIVRYDETQGMIPYLQDVQRAVGEMTVARACVERMEISMKGSGYRGNERDRTSWADMELLVLATSAALTGIAAASPGARVEFSTTKVWKGNAKKPVDQVRAAGAMGWGFRRLSDHVRPTDFGRYEPPYLFGFDGEGRGAEWKDGMDAVSMAQRTLERRAVRRP